MKRRLVRLLQKYLLNPPVKAAMALGVAPRTHALLETTGRTSGKRRRNPVGNGLADDGRTFWIVAEHGHQAGYVKNLVADPRVRVKVGRRWRSGRAEVLEDDDANTRLDAIGRRVNGAVVRLLGTDLLTIRITLEDG